MLWAEMQPVLLPPESDNHPSRSCGSTPVPYAAYNSQAHTDVAEYAIPVDGHAQRGGGATRGGLTLLRRLRAPASVAASMRHITGIANDSLWLTRPNNQDPLPYPYPCTDPYSSLNCTLLLPP